MRIAAAATAALFLCATAGGASAQSAKLMTDWRPATRSRC